MARIDIDDTFFERSAIIAALFVMVLFLAITLRGDVDKEWDGRMYVASNNITFSWNASDGATKYMVQAVDIDHSLASVDDLGETTETSMVLNQKRTGHYMYRVRACNSAGCSAWAESTDPTYATVDGNPMAWRIYWKVPSPTGGTVN